MTPRTKPFGLDKTERLLKRRQFLRCRSECAQIGRSRNFTFLFRTNELGFSRLGITASKRVGCAVVRNRIKRVTREFFRKNKHIVPPGLDIVVIAGPGSAALANEAIRHELERLLEFNP